MKNIEQQPTSNLQTLETELSLTKAEMEEFRKLPKEEQEKRKDEKLEKLKALQGKLDEAIQEAIRTGSIDEVKRLKETLNKEITDLEDIFNKIESIIKIDRTTDIIEFIGWKRAKIEDKDTDARSIALTEIDLSKLKLDTSWLGDKSIINGGKRLEILKASENIRLDAQILITLLKLPQEELEKKMEIIAEANKVSIDDLKNKSIFFDGTIVRPIVSHPDGECCVLLLYLKNGQWSWSYLGINSNWSNKDPSLVLESDSV